MVERQLGRLDVGNRPVVVSRVAVPGDMVVLVDWSRYQVSEVTRYQVTRCSQRLGRRLTSASTNTALIDVTATRTEQTRAARNGRQMTTYPCQLGCLRNKLFCVELDIKP